VRQQLPRCAGVPARMKRGKKVLIIKRGCRTSAGQLVTATAVAKARGRKIPVRMIAKRGKYMIKAPRSKSKIKIVFRAQGTAVVAPLSMKRPIRVR
jgi:hypothetical protein